MVPQLRIGPINAASPTPLTAGGTLDCDSARRLCRRWVDVGLDGVLVLGSMGEGLLLDEHVRMEFLEIALEEAGGKLTLFACAADHTYEGMRERALRYARMGAPCIVLCLTPGGNAQEAMWNVRRVAEACPVPCAYYEVPTNTGIALNLCDLLEVLSHPNIVALKDSSNNVLLGQALTSATYRPRDVALLDGVEYRVAFSAAVGYDGVVHGGGVLTARRVRTIWEHARCGRMREAVALDRENSLCLGSIYNRFSSPLQNVVGQKYALKLLGVLDDPRVEVDQRLDETSCERIRRTVDENLKWIA